MRTADPAAWMGNDTPLTEPQLARLLFDQFAHGKPENEWPAYTIVAEATAQMIVARGLEPAL